MSGLGRIVSAMFASSWEYGTGAHTTILGNHRYRSVSRPSDTTYHARDVTVVIPTTDILSNTFHHVVNSILKHSVAHIVIPTAGTKAKGQRAAFETLFSDPRILVLHREGTSRRQQTAQAMKYVRTPLLILQDDHTYWPNEHSFLQSVIAPFEEPTTGAVGVVLEARHRQHPFSFSGLWNFLAYLNEHVLFGMMGPMNVDDDKFHTRWLIDHGWNIVLQAGPETTMTTELGEWPKFNEQVLRWMRTSYRSNPRQLLHGMSWIRYPYTRFNLLVWFFRLSLIQEPLMFWLLHATLQTYGELEYFKITATALYMWVVAMKFIKISAHFEKHPRDIVYFPAYLKASLLFQKAKGIS
ncbi:hypothetical protein BDU57DRAFT_575823 [Ampelomyces quisqualis]|uniref:Nucleotide-diphospho-sugar transferase n=1 Tax=Ampelomyces quisqualis TaxID=50730 RepID=A0A6A5QQH2_AMPQU|nr:hypothetical protein BDU57DRAFT_575823 [Ampelomyces quisqualis]